MKKYDDRVAQELEGVEAEKSGDFANRKLYVLSGQPGRLYRRLYKPKKGEFVPEGAVEAVCNGSVQVFLPVPELDRELAEAGFTANNHVLATEFTQAMLGLLTGRAAELSATAADESARREPEGDATSGGEAEAVLAASGDDEF